MDAGNRPQEFQKYPHFAIEKIKVLRFASIMFFFAISVQQHCTICLVGIYAQRNMKFHHCFKTNKNLPNCHRKTYH